MRYKRPDNKSALSIIDSAKKTMDYTLTLEVNEQSAITIARNIYECFRMLGDAVLVIKGIVSEEDYLVLEKYTRALFQRGTEIAASRGLILVDTKYEFGKTKDGKIVLIDEIHTPDSSRYFYREGYEERQKNNEQQKQLSKEFVRKWLIDNGFQGKEDQLIPEMTPEFVKSISDRYIELYEQITGDKFIKHDHSNALKRVENNIIEAIKRLS